MKSPVVKRSIVVSGHKTSISLEEPFWLALKEMAGARGITLSEAVAQIDRQRSGGNLSSAIRTHVLAHYRALAAASGGRNAGDGENPINDGPQPPA